MQQGLPGGTDLARAQARVVRSKIITMFHLTGGGAGNTNVQNSILLPTPCIIRSLIMGQSSTGTSSRSHSVSLYVANNNSISIEESSFGEAFTAHLDAGATPPDIDAGQPRDLSWLQVETKAPIPLYIPVMDSPAYIKSVAYQGIAAACRFWFIFVVDILSGPIQAPGVDIVPRGTEEEPVCVRICPDGAPPPPPPPPPPPDEEEPEPPIEGIDPLADPLPVACNVDPLFPLADASALCDVP